MASQGAAQVPLSKVLSTYHNAGKEKLTDFTTDDRSAMLLTLTHIQDTLGRDDKDLPSGIHDALNQLRQKLEVVKVCYNALVYPE